jgi:hypothetical protein
MVAHDLKEDLEVDGLFQGGVLGHRDGVRRRRRFT